MTETTVTKPPIGYTNASLGKEPRSIPWLWEGVVAEGAITLLSAPEKTGKTTLLSLLLDRMRAGGELLGRTVWPAKTVLCSEEDRRLWALRQPPLDFGPDLRFHTPMSGCPTKGRWRRFINDLLELSFPDSTFDLLVIDTAVSFMPLFDRNKRTLRWALSELELVTHDPIGVLMVNQSRTVQRPLAAFADIVIEMTVPRGHAPLSPSGRGAGGEGTRRRTFTGVGRYPGTLQTATAELNADGTDYVPVEANAAPRSPLLPTLQTLLAETPLTCRELLERWPAPAPRPDSVWRVLARSVELGLFTESGKGTKAEPFRFGVAGRGDATDVDCRSEPSETADIG